MSPRRYASIAETAVYLRVSSKTIRRMISSGQVTAYRFGRRLLRIDLNEVDARMHAIPTAKADS